MESIVLFKTLIRTAQYYLLCVLFIFIITICVSEIPKAIDYGYPAWPSTLQYSQLPVRLSHWSTIWGIISLDS
jgi:hypothetical protein